MAENSIRTSSDEYSKCVATEEYPNASFFYINGHVVTDIYDESIALNDLKEQMMDYFEKYKWV